MDGQFIDARHFDRLCRNANRGYRYSDWVTERYLRQLRAILKQKSDRSLSASRRKTKPVSRAKNEIAISLTRSARHRIFGDVNR